MPRKNARSRHQRHLRILKHLCSFGYFVRGVLDENRRRAQIGWLKDYNHYFAPFNDAAVDTSEGGKRTPPLSRGGKLLFVVSRWIAPYENRVLEGWPELSEFVRAKAFERDRQMSATRRGVPCSQKY